MKWYYLWREAWAWKRRQRALANYPPARAWPDNLPLLTQLRYRLAYSEYQSACDQYHSYHQKAYYAEKAK
jgi:hypothetical protein